MIHLDSETVGFYGLPVLLQYAEDHGQVKLHEPWKCPIRETLQLLDWICDRDVNGFNLAFDWFHICKLYTTFSSYHNWDHYPEDHIEELAYLEEQARFKDICLKPKNACDIMLHTRKGPLQSLMNRDPIKIRKVPNELAFELAEELNARIKFDDIYFAKSKKDPGGRWKVFDIIDSKTQRINPHFKNVVLRFKASGALKNLYRHAFNVTEPIYTFGQIELDHRWRPNEVGYAPYALALAEKDDSGVVTDWKWTWPQVIHEHILHWNYNEAARKYAVDDVEYTRRLYYEYFNSPAPGDRDSNLACMVAACRWRGYSIDIPKIERLRADALSRMGKYPTAPAPVKRWLMQVCNDVEKLMLESTKKATLETMVREWKCDDDESKMHPAAERAEKVLDARKAAKEVELYDKLLLAKRFHASFNVIGALSSRMSGSDQLNAQGINHAKKVREAFTLNDDPRMELDGGDFKSFEVSLAAKVFDSPKLYEDLTTGIKIHAIFGMKLFPGTTYEEVVASDGTNTGIDMYDSGKKGVFSVFYGGEDYTIQTRLSVPIEVARDAFQYLITRYKEIGEDGRKMYNDYASLSQPGGLGSRVEYKKPKDYVESFLGFRRYFILENSVIKALYDLANSPPESWRKLKIRVVRREKIQTAGGAVMSALFAAAFGLQGSIIRQAKNHRIQSPGAEITKEVQHAIWQHQPVGIHPFYVQPMNVHDEIMCPTRREIRLEVRQSVLDTVAHYKKIVPLLAIDWFMDIPNWASKKGVPVDADKAKDVQPIVRREESSLHDRHSEVPNGLPKSYATREGTN